MKGLVYLGSNRAKHERVSSRPVIGSHLHGHYAGKHREGYTLVVKLCSERALRKLQQKHKQEIIKGKKSLLECLQCASN